MAPEQFQASLLIDIRADIYSLGATLFHLLTGRLPFPNTNVMKMVANVVGRSLPDPRSVRSDCSEDLAMIVCGAGVLRPNRRYQNPRDIREDLEAVLSGRHPAHVPVQSAETTVVIRRKDVQARAVQEPTPSSSLLDVLAADFIGSLKNNFHIKGAVAIAEAIKLLDAFEASGRREQDRLKAISHVLYPQVELSARAREPFAHALLLSIESLARQLHGVTQHVNASSMRTLRIALERAQASVCGKVRDPTLEQAVVLVVDDDLVSRKTMCQALAKVGLRTEAVDSAAHALAALERSKFSLILSDVLMSGMNGFQFIAAARQVAGAATIPIILVTSLADFDKVFQASAEGADDAIAKPFLFMELAAKSLTHLRPADKAH
jgi:CheY-like chemotaxis protein